MFLYENIGTKKTQEDYYFILKHNNIEYYFVLDGHGFKNNEIFIIDYLKKNDKFNKYIKMFFNKYSLNETNIINFFTFLDNIIKKNNINSGTCITGLIIDNNSNLLYLLNLGDTIYYIYKQSKLFFKSEEHNLKNLNEIERIKKFNKLKNIKNGRYKNIIMTRVLGDFDCKDKKNNPIIPYPEIKIFKKQDMIVFLTTDGIKFNYDIDFIINLYLTKQNVKEYCDELNKLNVLKYKKTSVDNILFLIIPVKAEKINEVVIKKNNSVSVVQNIQSNTIPKAVKEILFQPPPYITTQILINEAFIYNCLKNCFY